MADVSAGAAVGLLEFTATGAGTFDEPRYDVKLRVDDLFVGDEGIGQLNGRLSLRGELLTLELEAASPRLVVSGSGRIALTDEMDAELTLRFADTSLDPYVRFFEPRLSPFTTAVASGTVRVVGELADIDHLVVDAHVEQLDLKLFDYRVHERRADRALARSARARRSSSCGSSATAPSSQLDGNVDLHEPDDRRAGPGDATSGSCRGSSATSAARGSGDAQGGDQRAARQAGVLRQRDDHRRPRPAALAAALARGDQRPDLVRRRGHPPRRRDGAARRAATSRSAAASASPASRPASST